MVEIFISLLPRPSVQQRRHLGGNNGKLLEQVEVDADGHMAVDVLLRSPKYTYPFCLNGRVVVGGGGGWGLLFNAPLAPAALLPF
jgi:hypothetical protein